MEKPAIYFDNAATSWPKPEAVYHAAEHYLRCGGANPGRSAHARSLASERLLYECRERAAAFLGAEKAEQIIFTLNATDALNMAIKGMLEAGDHVVYSSFEHNSVLRPLYSLRESGLISTTMISPTGKDAVDAASFDRAIRPETKLLICTHASNITGRIMPVQAIGKVAAARGVFFLLDTAQTAGALPLNVQEIGAHLAVFTGHKSLLGPPGVGLLYLREGVKIKPWREGGTGSRSDEEQHPKFLPDYLEAGTMNTPGIAGLNEGLKFITATGVETIRAHELKLCRIMLQGLAQIDGVKVFRSAAPEHYVAVISFVLEGLDSGELGYILEEGYGILCRTGLHCAPQAHRAISTFPAGTVRFSFGYFNTEEEVNTALKALSEVSRRLFR
ncbi:MAG: aminotransferase class V-fold PLP-dependent enzyme [Bacillota bacterium]